MKSSEIERFIVLGTIAVCVVMIAYPPLQVQYQALVGSVGYSFIWSIPNGASIDLVRLLLQLAAVIAVAAGAIYWRRTRAQI